MEKDYKWRKIINGERLYLVSCIIRKDSELYG